MMMISDHLHGDDRAKRQHEVGEMIRERQEADSALKPSHNPLGAPKEAVAFHTWRERQRCMNHIDFRQ